jgi:hypothetical protein
MRFYQGYLIACLLWLCACSKSDYLTDGGLHDPKTPLSLYAYLEQHPYQLFDSLLTIVDHYQLQEELSQTTTFFAPTDYSINLYMELRKTEKRKKDENADYTMDSLFKELSADSIRQYMFTEKLPITSFQDEQVHLYKNAAGISCGLRKEKNTTMNEWSSQPVYLLYYVKIVGQQDVAGVTPPVGEEDINVLCQTTGIETSSGTGPLLHVLSNKHFFTRF